MKLLGWLHQSPSLYSLTCSCNLVVSLFAESPIFCLVWCGCLLWHHVSLHLTLIHLFTSIRFSSVLSSSSSFFDISQIYPLCGLSCSVGAIFAELLVCSYWLGSLIFTKVPIPVSCIASISWVLPVMNSGPLSKLRFSSLLGMRGFLRLGIPPFAKHGWLAPILLFC